MDDRGQTSNPISLVTILVTMAVGIMVVEQIPCASKTVVCFGWLYKILPVYLGTIVTLLGSFVAGLVGKLAAHRMAHLDGP